MIVAVSEELKNVKEGLEKMGFKTVVYGKYQGPVDAVVFSKKPQMTAVMPLQNYRSEGGVFMLCANGRTTDDIAQCLKRRSYSKLL